MSGTLYGVGAGTGDPELLTLKGLAALRHADKIVCPNSGKKSALEPVIDLVEGARDKLMSVDFAMSRDACALKEARDAAFAVIAAELDKGHDVAFLTLGDPSLYSTFTPMQSRALAAGYEVRTIPGIISPCAAAAAANRPLVVDNERLTIFPTLESCDFPDTALALMKVKFRFDEVVEELSAQGRLDDAYLAVRVGMEGEEIREDLASCEKPSSYFSTIVVSGKRGRTDTGGDRA